MIVETYYTLHFGGIGMLSGELMWIRHEIYASGMHVESRFYSP